MLLKNIIETFDTTKLSEELDAIADKLSLLEDASVMAGSEQTDLMDLMGDAIIKFTAARKGLGIANKLKDADERKKHKGKIMGVMNKLRAVMSRIDTKIKSLGKTLSEAAIKDPEQSFRQMDKLAQAVWATKDVEAKKTGLNKMIDSFKFKEKQDKFRAIVKREESATKLDKLAADLMHVGHGDKVVK